RRDRLQVERDRAVGPGGRPRSRPTRPRAGRRRRALTSASVLLEGDVLRALPEELLPERAQVLRLRDAARVEHDLPGAGVAGRVLGAEPEVEVAEGDPARLAAPADVDDPRLEGQQA